jgi:hypothetical protein
MPNEEYAGDAVSVRIASVALINKGDWTVPKDTASQFGERGQYFYESTTGKWYSKYGILNILIYVPILWMEKSFVGELSDASLVRPCFLNLFNLAFTVATAVYLALLAFRYTRSSWAVWLFVLCCFYSTFWWNYLRAQTFEIYIAFFMLAFCYHLLRAFDAPRIEPRLSQRVHYLCAALYFGALCLSKSVYLILVPVVGVVFLVYWRDFRKVTVELATPVKGKLLVESLWFWLPLLLMLAVLLISNAARFGSAWNCGYTQWVHSKQLFTANLAPAIRGYLFSKQRSIFVNFPVLIFALAGWRRFCREHLLDSITFLCIGLVIFVVNASFLDWRGDACYGPRYLLPIAAILSIPFVYVVESLSRLRHMLSKWGAIAVVVLVLAYSVVLQIGVNTMPFFFWYYLRGIFSERETGEPVEYLKSHHFGTINLEYLMYVEFGLSPFGDHVIDHLTLGEEREMSALQDGTSKANYLLFPNVFRTSEGS